MYTLYSIGGTCSTGITALLKKLNQEVTIIQRDTVDDYNKIVPTNQVPALNDNGFFLTEGAAIALYLLEKHPNNMLPIDLKAKAEFYRWLMFDYATLHPSYSKVLAIGRTMDDNETNKQIVMQKLADKVSLVWDILNKRLSTREFIVGDSVTIVDYLATIYTSWGHYVPGIKITLGEHVERLATQVSSLPEFISAYQQENATFTIAK